jgi:hypothetical protein
MSTATELWKECTQPPAGMGAQNLKKIQERVYGNSFKVPLYGHKFVFTPEQCPVVFKDGKVVIFEHGFVKLFDEKFNLVKEMKSKITDRLDFNGSMIYHQRAPKEKWKRLLWEVGLVKRNWRHPNNIQMRLIDDSFCVEDRSTQVTYSITVYKTGTNALFWHAHVKETPAVILQSMAERVKKIMNTKGWVK